MIRGVVIFDLRKEDEVRGARFFYYLQVTTTRGIPIRRNSHLRDKNLLAPYSSRRMDCAGLARGRIKMLQRDTPPKIPLLVGVIKYKVTPLN